MILSHVDEFQNFVTESFATILSEARVNESRLPISIAQCRRRFACGLGNVAR